MSLISRHLGFLHQWARNPRQTASVVPSSVFLARAMSNTAQKYASSPRILELGPGNGAITKELVRDFGVDNVVALDLNEHFVDVLNKRFPGLHVHQGDARFLGDLSFEPSVIVSSLGFLAMPKDIVRDILLSCFAVLPQDGILVQYTYGSGFPVPENILHDTGLVCQRITRVWRNVPPATVYIIRRSLEERYNQGNE